jgi:hypothetical protein
MKIDESFLLNFVLILCSIEHSVVPSQCEHCQPGYQCDPSTGACIKGKKVVPEFFSRLQLASLCFFILNFYQNTKKS